jgi:hypothetical protein
MKRKLLIPLLVGFICLFGLAGPAYAAPLHTQTAHTQTAKPPPKGVVRPDFTATGGGCTNKGLPFLGATVTITACISGWGSLTGWSVGGDAYVKFPAALDGYWNACTVTVEVYDRAGGFTGYGFPCTDDANSGHNAHYGPNSSTTVNCSSSCPCPKHFYTKTIIDAYWGGGSHLTGNVSSSDENINC